MQEPDELSPNADNAELLDLLPDLGVEPATILADLEAERADRRS